LIWSDGIRFWDWFHSSFASSIDFSTIESKFWSSWDVGSSTDFVSDLTDCSSSVSSSNDVGNSGRRWVVREFKTDRRSWSVSLVDILFSSNEDGTTSSSWTLVDEIDVSWISFGEVLNNRSIK